jgi:hypothetical protein
MSPCRATQLWWILPLTVLACGCLVQLPAASVASSVALADRPAWDLPPGHGGIEYSAAPGEANRIVLTQRDALTIRVVDSGAVIVPGHGCRAIDAHTADCSLAGMPGFVGLRAARVRTGDGDDDVLSEGPGLTADGGRGSDTLRLSSGASGTLDGGGGGHDVLLGGRNRDTLIDGDASGSADSDVLRGGANGAIVSYASRTAPVSVDLADPRAAGEAGERDELGSVTGVVGGRGPDDLRGDEHGNDLRGGPGADRLSGGGGEDCLYGDTGADRLSGQAGGDCLDGGPGPDTASGGTGNDIVRGDRGRDRLTGGSGQDELLSGAARCGPGHDHVSPSTGDFVARDCEMATFSLSVARDEVVDEKGIFVHPYPVRSKAASVTLRVRCPYTETDEHRSPLAIEGSVRIAGASGLLFGRAAIPVTGSRCAESEFKNSVEELPWVRIRVPLTPAGSAALSARRTSIARITFSGRNVPPVAWRIDWRR